MYLLFVSELIMFYLFSFYINVCGHKVSPEMEVLAMMTLETSLRDSDLVGVPGSLLAAAALCMAKWILDTSSSSIENTVWNSALANHTGHRAEKLMTVMKRLACNILNEDITQKLRTHTIQDINTKIVHEPIKTKYKNYKFVQNILQLGHQHPKQRRHTRAHLRLVELGELAIASDLFSS